MKKILFSLLLALTLSSFAGCVRGGNVGDESDTEREEQTKETERETEGADSGTADRGEESGIPDSDLPGGEGSGPEERIFGRELLPGNRIPGVGGEGGIFDFGY